jgi:DNA-binding PadR family transcriptional regulator
MLYLRSWDTACDEEEGYPLSITSDLIRGHTETIILAHLCVKESYGYEINKSIQEKSGGLYELKEATLYSAFRRLEENGAIESYWGDETTGARRRYYRVTGRGRQLYGESVDEWHAAKALIDKLIEERKQTHE